MKINNILKIAGYSIVLILFVFFIGKISQNEYEDEDDKKILEIEKILKNREEKNNVKIIFIKFFKILQFKIKFGKNHLFRFLEKIFSFNK